MNKALIKKCDSIIKKLNTNNRLDYDALINELDKNKDYRTNGQHKNAVQYLIQHNIIITENKNISKLNFTISELNDINSLIAVANEDNTIDISLIELQFNNKFELISEYIESLGYNIENISDKVSNYLLTDNVDDIDENTINKYEYTESNNLDSLHQYLKDISQYSLLTPDEEYELAVKYRDTKKDIYKNKLINHNLRLVVYIAKQYNNKSPVPLMDLIQYGNIGLMNAIEKYDPSMAKLSTYAIVWIKQSILRGIGNDSRIIRVPIHAAEQAVKNRKSKVKLTKILDREPSEQELVDYINENKLFTSSVTSMDIPTLRLFEKVYENYVVSLNVPVNNFDGSDESTLEDFIESDQPTASAIVERKIVSEDIHQILKRVFDGNEKEYDILALRFGLADGRTHTLQDIAEKYNVSRERIRQIETKAIRRLRHPKYKKLFVDFVS